MFSRRKARKGILMKKGSGEEVEEEKEYLGGLIKIKITAEDDFYSSFLKLS